MCGEIPPPRSLAALGVTGLLYEGCEIGIRVRCRTSSVTHSTEAPGSPRYALCSPSCEVTPVVAAVRAGLIGADFAAALRRSIGARSSAPEPWLAGCIAGGSSAHARERAGSSCRQTKRLARAARVQALPPRNPSCACLRSGYSQENATAALPVAPPKVGAMYISVPAATLLPAVALHVAVPLLVQEMIALPCVGAPVLPAVTVAA